MLVIKVYLPLLRSFFFVLFLQLAVCENAFILARAVPGDIFFLKKEEAIYTNNSSFCAKILLFLNHFHFSKHFFIHVLTSVVFI